MRSAAHRTITVWLLTGSALLIGLLLPCVGAFAAPAGPAWSIRFLAQPTNFSAANDEGCELHEPEGLICDSYTLLVTNTGSQTAGGAPIVVTDTLPDGVAAVHIHGDDQSTLHDLNCRPIVNASFLQCVDNSEVPAGDTLLITINVVVRSGVSGKITNSASVAGGGAPAVATTEETAVDAQPAPFEIRDFSFQALDSGGAPDMQAAGHPFSLTTSFDFTTLNEDTLFHGWLYGPPEEVKDVVVDLPLGFVGDPQATPKCSLTALLLNSGKTQCPAASRIGTLTIELPPDEFAMSEGKNSETTAIYNMEPEGGYPAEFGFTYFGKPLLMYASAAWLGSSYGLRVTAPGVPELGTMGASLTFFGDPALRDGGSSKSSPFFTDPVDCAGGSTPARIEVNTWEHPETYYSREAPVFSGLVGCEMLQFQPTLEVQPETTQADEPSGYRFDIGIPQRTESFVAPGTPELKNATVTLPPGVSVSPAAADGLAACEATGPHGIDIPAGHGRAFEKPGEGEETGADGLSHLSPGHCPGNSMVGTAEVTTPLLPSPLEGHVFLAQPGCGGEGQAACTEEDAADGNLIHVYLEVAGSGVVVKLPGSVSLNRITGQLTATFRENPQLPVSRVVLDLDGGPRASLANPPSCGEATTTSDLSPWSSPTTPDATPASSFPVDWYGKGGAEAPCPSTPPFAPSLVAGTVSPAAGAFSPFTLTLSRGDRQQYLSQLSVSTPPGLLGMLSSVTLCGEPQAAQGACPASSEIGTTTVAAGPGSHPFWITGRVYLTVGYRGAPFGLSVVVPAKAGPFNLGDVVVRAAINVDPNTSALTVTSDPLPQIIDGVPLRVQTVNVTIGRPGFMFNPTNCEAHQITATVGGSGGAAAQLSSPFAAAGCRGLPFSPTFAVSSQARTSKANGASLKVKVSYRPAQSNIRSVAVRLPKQLPARLTTIQHACLAATFAANPATCPAGSLIGIATASTPVLPVPVSGPAYLVSHGGAAFPDVVLILQGDGVRVDLTGNINIAKGGITSSTFANVPDVPIATFELNLPEGAHSALATNLPASAKGNLCGAKLVMPTTLTGQNGLQVKQGTKVAISGCPKARSKKKPTKRAGKADRGPRNA
jgi:hypothetical protein